MPVRLSKLDASVRSLDASPAAELGTNRLARLNFFDGFLLRATHLETEQRYGRTLAHLMGRAQGWGVVEGFDVSTDGETVSFGPGFALNPQGRPLLMERPTEVPLIDLLATRAQGADVGIEIAADFTRCDPDARTGDGPPARDGLYRICIGPSERLCGQEDVMGALCDNACVTDWDRPYVVEGVRAWLEPIEVSLASSSAVSLQVIHERSLVASAYFRQQREAKGHLISAAGLRSTTWCNGARGENGECVPLGVIMVRGTTATFLDAWTARRERIESPPRHYWAYKMRMRPYRLFLAEVLQFQCQLAELPDGGSAVPDPCADERALLDEARSWLADARTEYERILSTRDAASIVRVDGGFTRIDELERKISDALRFKSTSTNRRLIDGGIVELPPAGYLPVVPTSTLTVNEQVRAWMGEGVDLRFCRVRHDFVQHAFEEAQHMDRISLLQGLDDPNDRPEVDILVPDGEILSERRDAEGAGFAVEAAALFGFPRTTTDVGDSIAELRTIAENSIDTRGAARGTYSADEGVRFLYAGAARTRASRNGGKGGNTNFDTAANELAYAVHAAKSAAPNAPAPRVDTKTGRAERIKQLMELAAEAVINQPSTGAAFVEGTSDVDPLGLDIADRARVGVRAMFGGPDEEVRFGIADISGEFTAEQVFRSADAVSIRGPLRAWGSSTSHQRDGTVDNGSFSETLGLRIDAMPQVGVAKFVAELNFSDDEAIRFIGSVEPIGPETFRLRIDVTERRDTEIRRVIAFESRILRSDAALREGSLPRTLADQALTFLDVVSGEPGFAEGARAFLFGEDVTSEDTLVMRATRDWVLFHRRRTKTCTPVVSHPPQTRPDRRYQVFHITEERVRNLFDAGSVNDVPAALANAFLNGDTAVLQTIRRVASPVAVAAYRDGLAELTTSATALAADLATVGAEDEIVFSVVASDGTTDGESLELQRGLALHLATASVSRRATDIEELWLEDVPLTFVTPQTDGFQLLVTRDVPAGECQTIYGATESEYKRSLIEEHIASGNFAAALNALGSFTRVGRADFDAGTAGLQNPEAEIRVAWKAYDPNGTAVVVAARALATDTPVALARQRALRIATLLGLPTAEANRVEAVPLPGTVLPEGCPSAVVVLVEPNSVTPAQPSAMSVLVTDTRRLRSVMSRLAQPGATVEAALATELRVASDGNIPNPTEARVFLRSVTTNPNTRPTLVVRDRADVPSDVVRASLVRELRAAGVVDDPQFDLEVRVQPDLPEALFATSGALLLVN